jgi:homoserine O-acetyltransferase
MSLQTFTYHQTFTLESGKTLPALQIGYHTYGQINASRDNVVWVCHALTANSDVLDWWKGFFGDGQYFDPKDYFIVCANVLGSAYGTTSPLSLNPETNQPYYLNFPLVTIRDMVKAHQLLAEHLNISSIEVMIGGSVGGQQSMEWAIEEPDFVKNLILIAASANLSPWAIGFNESQRLAIEADATFDPGRPNGGQKGLKAARSIALLSYRSHAAYNISQKEENNEGLDNFRSSSYQRYQGDKLVKRFNAYSYWYLTKAMDTHNVGRGRGSVEQALGTIKAKTLVIGIDSDVLFPVEEQQFLHKHIPQSAFCEFKSVYGHDGFLIETAQLTQVVKTFLETKAQGNNIHLQHTA